MVSEFILFTELLEKKMDSSTSLRDEFGRVVADDGWPKSGLATVAEVVAISGLSRSKIYNLMRDGTLETRCFGRSRRMTWSSVRATFLADRREA